MSEMLSITSMRVLLLEADLHFEPLTYRHIVVQVHLVNLANLSTPKIFRHGCVALSRVLQLVVQQL